MIQKYWCNWHLDRKYGYFLELKLIFPLWRLSIADKVYCAIPILYGPYKLYATTFALVYVITSVSNFNKSFFTDAFECHFVRQCSLWSCLSDLTMRISLTRIWKTWISLKMISYAFFPKGYRKPTFASNPSDWQFSSNLIFGSDQSVGELKFGSRKQKKPSKVFKMRPKCYVLYVFT